MYCSVVYPLRRFYSASSCLLQRSAPDCSSVRPTSQLEAHRFVVVISEKTSQGTCKIPQIDNAMLTCSVDTALGCGVAACQQGFEENGELWSAICYSGVWSLNVTDDILHKTCISRQPISNSPVTYAFNFTFTFTFTLIFSCVIPLDFAFTYIYTCTFALTCPMLSPLHSFLL